MALLSRVLHHHSDRPDRRERSSSFRSNSSSSSFSNLTPTRSGPPSISHYSTSPSFSISVTLESPPIVLYGQPSESTGSIISGLLNSSSEAEIDVESVTLSLVQTIRYTKPFLLASSTISNCKDCTTKTTTLARWDVLTTRCSFAVGSHAYPFSHLLPGSLPASCKLGSPNSQSYIKYDLIAVAKKSNSNSETIVKLPINISRSILRGPDRNSLRVFPPTEVTAAAVLPNVVYPKSTFPVELKLNYVVNAAGDRRWRMRKLTWKIEETIKTRASSCAKHEQKRRALEAHQKKIPPPKDNPVNRASNHHSNIHTSMSFLAHPRNNGHHNLNGPDNSAPDDSEPVTDDVVNDVEEMIRSGPSHAHENFIEDFGSNGNVESSRLRSNQLPTSNNITPEPTQQDLGEYLYIEETRAVSHGEIKSGWKSDFSGRGTIELVADISAYNCSSGFSKNVTKMSSDDDRVDDLQIGLRNGANICCDMDDPCLGVFVFHTLILEVIVAEEIVHNLQHKRTERSEGILNLTPVDSSSSALVDENGAPTPTTEFIPSTTPSQMGVPTGAARVLRMQFKLCVTERSGLGIAWDDEVPPTYEDVRTLSPPTYTPKGTPVTGPVTGSVVSASQTPGSGRGTPNVLYGVGETPLMGSLGLNREVRPLNLDELADLDERIQELSL
ncbi:conserved hypothetical protein [Scheffersomyces stipitis CBS 6054]|uniref:LDB19 N-terminal domain-containing protein n=1 Tax=Scheffersomyces stipitis (strain ATCC 58785 / CBS 6054 / NBRC 10063 / NRRL Y-11545) TaxID=322104 RepID=A3LQA7_PICST|nr:conserved hypothetical protein [Scheffersomyces stipitis CBS 6054]ABN65176.2 conserved hypothetical protein [Scheffersomyces stipitis CBS 6054]